MASNIRLAFPVRPASVDAAAPAVRTAGPNPYVGPRPFELGERLWGRDEEISALYYLLSAERIVLLHSPSGAGKSSLVQAGLIPLLRERFDVWRPTRVNQEPALAPSPASSARPVNRYVHSAILGFEEGIPPELRRPPAALAGLSLAEYAAGRPPRPGAPQSAVLIFDQFEEVLTVEPLAVAAKEAFFDQLGELLHDARLWALFVLREDYLAPLDPYAERVPTHLRNRFRIDLLGLAAARVAIVNPAWEGGRAFPAADRLVHDLATMKIQRPDGSFEEATGIHVEPVQLQVVCRRLWDALPADDVSIDAEDLERFGNVTAALAAYYAGAVARIAGGDAACERAVRDWFGERLITPGGIRAQVLMGAGESEGLANDVIEKLRATHLVRAEKRAGATWFELAHDRLIEPVRSDNAAWREEHLSPVQRRAALWASQGRPRGLLLTPGELPGEEVWTLAAEAEATQTREFVAASAEVQEKQQLEVELAHARRIRKLTRAAWVCLALAVGFGVFAAWQWRQTDAQRQVAVRNGEEAEGQAKKAKRNWDESERQAETAKRNRDEAERQARKAKEQEQKARANGKAAEAQAQKAREQEQKAMAAQKLAEEEGAEARRALAWAYREDAQRLLAAGQRKEALAYLAQALRLDPASAAARGRIFAVLADPVYSIPSGPLRHGGAVSSAAFSLDGERVLTASKDGTARLWDAATGAQVQVLRSAGSVAQNAAGSRMASKVLAWLSAAARGKPAVEKPVVAASLSPDGTRVATASGDGVRLWDAATGKVLRELSGHQGAVLSVSFSADGRHVLTASKDETARVWDAATGQQVGEPLRHRGEVSFASWSPDGARVATASGDAAYLWDAAAGQPLGQPLPHKKAVRCVAWSPDGKRLVTASGNLAQVWDAATGQPLGELSGHKGEVLSASFSADGRHILTASKDETARVWDAATGQQVGEPLRHHGDVTFASFSPEGTRVVTASEDKTARVWSLQRAATTLPHPAAVLSASFSPDGRRVVTTGADGLLRSWDAATGRALGEPLSDANRAAGADLGASFPAFGRQEVKALADGTARIWDTETDQPVGEPLRHDGPIVAAAFSPDGRRLATASEDGTARVWDAVTGRPVGEPLRHDGPVLSAAWSPDGQRLVTASADGTARVWDALATADTAEDLAQAAETLAGLSVTDRGSVEAIPAARLAAQLAALHRAADAATEPRPTLAWFLHWYFTPPAERALSPLASSPRGGG